VVLPRAAWGDRFLDASDREGLPGTDVLVPIVGKRQEPIRGYSTVLRFDKDVFEVGSPPFDTAGTVSSGARMIVAGATDSTVRLGVVYSFTCPPEIPAGEADLIRVRLHVLDEAPPGLTYVGLQDIPPALNRMTACDGASLTPGLFGGVVRISNDAFIRGDVNGNGRVSVADPILNLSYQIQGGVLPCEDAADVDDDGEVNISDPIYSLFNIFDLGPRTPSPFPECGADPTLDLVRCQCHPACMVCGPTLDVAGGDSSTASVVLALAPERRIDEKTVAIPVYLSNETPLWGFEYTVEYPADEYSFLAVGGNVFEYCSGKDDPAAGRVRVGNVIRFDLAEALAPGIHGVGEVRFSARTPSGEKLPRLVEGFFAAEGGAEGTIEIGAITDVASAADSLPNTIRAMATPNPLNPSTTIRYAVPRSGPVTVEIFSAEGRVVRTLVAESQERGFHEAVWSGENNSGSRAGSGVYFYRIRASGLQETKKLVLLR
jgi:hypothetical protein